MIYYLRGQTRRDTAALWTSNDPTLGSGELGYETDTGKVKIGDGSTAWVSLTYLGGSGTGKIAIDRFLGGNAYVADGVLWARASYAFTLATCRLGAVTAPTGAALICDVEYHATDPASTVTIFKTLPQIAAAAHSGTSSDLSITAIAAGGWFRFDITQIGSTVVGNTILFELYEA